MRTSLRTVLLATGYPDLGRPLRAGAGAGDGRSRRQCRRAEHAHHAAERRPVAERPGQGDRRPLRRGLAEMGRGASRTGRCSSSSSARTSAPSTPGCWSRRAPAARPTASTVDSFQLALFVQNGVLQPLDAFFTKEEIDDLFPFIREGITGPDGHIYAWWWGTDLRVLYYNTDLVTTRAADLGRAAGGGARGRRRPASTACSSTAGAGRARPSTGWPTSGRRAASSSTTAASRSSARARTARRC